MGKGIIPPDSNYGKKQAGRIFRQPNVHSSVPPDPGASFQGLSFKNRFGQKYIPDELRSDGYPTLTQTATKKPFYEAQAVRYPAIPYRDMGLFNGFPFLLPENLDYLNLPVDERGEGSSFNFLQSGICSRFVTGIDVDTSLNGNTRKLGNDFDLEKSKDNYTAYDENGTFNRSIAANQYWNLAAIETDWAIQTNVIPSSYDTGYCYNPDGSSTEGLQLVTQDFEVVESYNLSSFPPHLRVYPDPTGSTQTQSIDPETNLILGSGANYSSVFFAGQNTGSYAEAYFPLTIQPDNTGAFVITLDEGVANYFDSHSDFGSKKAFNCNMMFDFNISNKDDEGFERNTIEYHSFPTKAYIIPAAGWEFSVVCSKIKGVYYQYDFNPQKRYPGDQTSYLGHSPLPNSQPLSFVHRIETPEEFGGGPISYNNLAYTHMPFEDAPTKAGITYGYRYQLEPLLTYLTPKISTDGTDQIHRQDWSQYTSPGFFSAEGTPDQAGKQFYVAAARDQIVVDAIVLEDHLSSENKNLNSRISSNQKIDGDRIRQTNYPIIGNSVLEKNPRKNKDIMARKIEGVNIGSDRVINVKIGDLTRISANKNTAIGCGVTTSRPTSAASPDFSEGLRVTKDQRRSNIGTNKSAFRSIRTIA